MRIQPQAATESGLKNHIFCIGGGYNAAMGLISSSMDYQYLCYNKILYKNEHLKANLWIFFIIKNEAYADGVIFANLSCKTVKIVNFFLLNLWLKKQVIESTW